MFDYVVRMLILLPLVAGMAVGALWLWRKVGPDLTVNRRVRHLNVIDAIPMGTAGRLALVEFGERRLLLSVTRGRIDLIAEEPKPAVFEVPDLDADA
ncbi:FliO/MopB family protein [Sphingobium boeckii]|uniref:Flagellar protein FliO/FliZ n=1 Tax=Sphingobium boeckii TaxID=1082345 RepID=A0A7W9AIU2_9SPHN|nr:flagellar biosynthetic protein FliO [Sphingobium boeckii]MBB5686445.1 flagellar protein FliO/FliZ [Sphingobium boeckii]